jgi:hypothetical protein
VNVTVELSEPTPELTERLRREVDQAHMLTGMKMSVMGGANPVSLYSLPAAASFLKIGSYEQAMRPNNQETIGYIDLPALEIWIREVFEDVELADAIRAEIDAGEAFGITAPRVKELLQSRALQVAPVAEAAEVAAEAPVESE